MSGELFWPGMKVDVKKYVEGCDICLRNKMEAATHRIFATSAHSQSDIGRSIDGFHRRAA